MLLKREHKLVFYILIISFFRLNAQIANYISNGSFEDDCQSIVNPINWPGTDSISCNSGGGIYGECSGLANAPLNGFTYQKARTGQNYMISTFFYQGVGRGYLQNRLKNKLIVGKTYCVRFYVNISGNSSYGMDSFGAYFGGADMDTISTCNLPLTYLTPQIQNLQGNIITDTLNWTLITGTFVANGTEKYAVIGNFRADTLINRTLINPTILPAIATDVCIDDVSCIPIDLPAYAGPNVSVIPGQSVYIGRPADVGIDEACTWYKLPSSSPVATAAGIWVSPAQTSTYVVEQQIWCGTVKYDTVVVYMNPVGLSTSSRLESEIRIFPNPANDLLQLEILNDDLFQQFKTVVIYNSTGKVIHEKILESGEKEISIQTEDFPSGFYLLQLSGANEIINKRFVVSR